MNIYWIRLVLMQFCFYGFGGCVGIFLFVWGCWGRRLLFRLMLLSGSRPWVDRLMLRKISILFPWRVLMLVRWDYFPLKELRRAICGCRLLSLGFSMLLSSSGCIEDMLE